MRKRTKKVTFDELEDNIEFYLDCPDCGRELIIKDFYKIIKCPNCESEFKPNKILARSKTHSNPSRRGFSMGEKYHES